LAQAFSRQSSHCLAVEDALDTPIRLNLTGGNAHESVIALDFITGFMADNVIDDNDYDAQAIIDLSNTKALCL
jgi:hypothetical protein